MGVFLWLCASPVLVAAEVEPFALRTGDRVVLVGDTLIEREQRFGFLETELLARFPQAKVRFRNLGWSADTVEGISRAYFDAASVGHDRLIEQVNSLKPTVLIVGYGMAESFAGEAGLGTFADGLNQFLDRVATDAREVVLLAPIAHEAAPAPFPDPTAHNRALAAYSAVIGRVASERGYRFIDLFRSLRRYMVGGDRTKRDTTPLTSNGIHLTEAGYWRLALEVARGLALTPTPIGVTLDADGTVREAVGMKVDRMEVSDGGLAFVAKADRLPTATSSKSAGPEPNDSQARFTRLAVEGLPTGRYTLAVDGEKVATGSSRQWSKGVRLTAPSFPANVRTSELRRLVHRKNRLYFHRYRPQNITYLLGFRKYEQGQNAKEIEQLDRSITEAESAIGELRRPEDHRFMLMREDS